jgi:hypothetical protein
VYDRTVLPFHASILQLYKPHVSPSVQQHAPNISCLVEGEEQIKKANVSCSQPARSNISCMLNTKPNISAFAKFGGKSRKFQQTDSSEELIMLAADISRLSNISPATQQSEARQSRILKTWVRKRKKIIQNNNKEATNILSFFVLSFPLSLHRYPLNICYA